MQENDLSDSQVNQVLQSENDSVLSNLNGSAFEVEQSGEIFSSSNPIKPTELTKLLVFGTYNPPTLDYNPHIRDYGATPPPIDYDMSDYMINGGGRYAYPSLFPAVKKFFDDNSFENRRYENNEIQNKLNLKPGDYKADVSQYITGIGTPDYFERAYIFGTTGFKIDSLKFEISDSGEKTIKNLIVVPIDPANLNRDNFDFESPNKYAQAITNTLLNPFFDPYYLSKGRGPVYINFLENGKPIEPVTYTKNDFQRDQVREKNDTIEFGSPTDYLKQTLPFMVDFILGLVFDQFLTYERESDNLNVIYGTPGNDPDLDIFHYKDRFLTAIQEIVKVVPDVADLLTNKLVSLLNDKIKLLNLPSEKIVEVTKTLTQIVTMPFDLGISAISDIFSTTFGYLIVGGNGNDTLKGGFKTDELQAGNGNDYGEGGLGNDRFYGGLGNDTYDDDGLIGILSSGNDYFEGGSGDDKFYGADGNDTAYGGANNDQLYGENGQDILYGGIGNDYAEGGSDNDTYYGGDGNDLADDDGSNGIPWSGNDYFDGGKGNDTFYGADGDDRGYGGEGDDQLYGENGNDQLYGEAGNDYLEGGSDNDTYYGGDGNDLADDDGSNGVPWSGNDYFDGGKGNDTFYGADGNDKAYGGEGDDLIRGENGRDTIYGGDGNDNIGGGYHQDSGWFDGPIDENGPNAEASFTIAGLGVYAEANTTRFPGNTTNSSRTTTIAILNDL